MPDRGLDILAHRKRFTFYIENLKSISMCLPKNFPSRKAFNEGFFQPVIKDFPSLHFLSFKKALGYPLQNGNPRRSTMKSFFFLYPNKQAA